MLEGQGSGHQGKENHVNSKEGSALHTTVTRGAQGPPSRDLTCPMFLKYRPPAHHTRPAGVKWFKMGLPPSSYIRASEKGAQKPF